VQTEEAPLFSADATKLSAPALTQVRILPGSQFRRAHPPQQGAVFRRHWQV
jgi:hypothetical protein